MGNAVKAAEDVKALAVRFRAILSLADCLEKIGSIENAENEAMQKKNAAYKEADQAIKSLEAKKIEIAKAEDSLAETEIKAVRLLEVANGKAADIIKAAVSRSDEIASEASKKKSFIEREVLDLRADIVNLNKDIADKKSDLAAIQFQLNSVKEKISAFVR